MPRHTVLETSDEEWDTVIAVNLTASFRFARAAIPAMAQAGGGAIALVASVWGLTAGPAVAAYAAAKAGVINLTRAIAIDHGPQRVRVNAVCPGAIDTPLMRHQIRRAGLETDRAMAESASGRPLRRVGKPEDVAAAIAYLVSASAAYITGTTLTLDGGWHAGG